MQPNRKEKQLHAYKRETQHDNAILKNSQNAMYA